VLFECRVTDITVRDGTVSGIKTENGDEYNAPIVISNANSSRALLKMVPDGVIKPTYRRRVEGYEHSVSAIQFYIGLNIPQADLHLENHTIVKFEAYDSNRNFEWIMRDDYENCFLSCINYTAWDPSLAVPGKSILQVFTLANYDNWKGLSPVEVNTKRDEAKSRILKRVKTLIPAVTDEKIEVLQMTDPLFYRDYFDNPDGAIYGINQVIGQIGVDRQSPVTPVGGLYLAGADTFPGAGHPSVISSGYRLAKYILSR
jgi:phytoene dehydrogenase-like protein